MGTNDYILEKILAHLNASPDNFVMTCAHYITRVYTIKTADRFSESSTGELFVKRGKYRDSLKYTLIKFGHYTRTPPPVGL
jgi:hypothetical protein